MTDRRSPLDAAHRALGAKMVPFGGWEMPLSYPSGTLAEHRACRSDAVAFDVSHLGTVRVEGPHALEHLNGTLTNDLHKIAPGRAQYTHLLDDGDASVLDDIIVWWVDEHHFDVMPNASNTERVVAALGGHDVTAERAIIAIQGPNARAKVAAVSDAAAAVPHFGVASFEWDGTHCLVAGTGYTGEDGIECSIPTTRRCSTTSSCGGW
ncbi:MAG: aminomethyltransferase, partial [Actinomycetota bacterium]|nr:aminomethyltransferase [Actinomycetota bacterium]